MGFLRHSIATLRSTLIQRRPLRLSSRLGATTFLIALLFTNVAVAMETHRVERQQTLSDIASSERMRALYPNSALYGLGGRLQTLLRLNPQYRTGSVLPGNKVLLLADEKAGDRALAMSSDRVEPKDPSVQTYRAQPGDSLSALSTRFLKGGSLYGRGGRLALMMQMNPQVCDADALFVGDLLIVNPNAESVKITSRELASAPDVVVPKNEEEVEKFERAPREVLIEDFSWLKFEPSAGFHRLGIVDSRTGATGDLVSDLSPGFRIAWKPQLGPSAHLGLGLDWTSIGWAPPPGRTLSGSRTSLLGISAEAGHAVSKKLDLTARIGQHESPILRATSLSVLGIEKIPLLYSGVDATYSLFQSGHFTGSGLVGGGLSFGAKNGTTTVKSGYFYRMGFDLSQSLQSGHIHGGIHFRSQAFDTDFSRNKFDSLELRFGYTLRLGK